MKKVLYYSLVGIAFIVIVTMTGAVSFYSNQHNCRSCHEMAQTYDSWQVSSHESVPCSGCHRRDSAKGAFSLRGTAIERIALHYFKETKRPKASVGKHECLQCHSSIKKKIQASKRSNIVNPHAAHLDAGYTCTDCHKRLVHAAKVTDSARPRMKNCVACHKSKEVAAECATCHYGSREHIEKIAQTGGYRLKGDEGCEVCHTEKDTRSTNHKKAMENIGGYTGVETCVRCHVYSGHGVSAGVHSRFTTKVAHVPGFTGEFGMGTYAAYPATWAYRLNGKKGTSKDAGCGFCHVGGSDVPTPATAAAIDCLICHAKNYNMKERKLIATDGGLKWVGDERPAAAYSVGRPVAQNCWRCHEDRMSVKRGTPYAPDEDVHATIGMSCQSCHVTVKHRIAKGSVADVMANDIPELSISCASCHIDYSHGDKDIDIHLKRLSCQACHVGRVDGLVVWDRTTGEDKDGDGFFTEKMVEGNSLAPVFMWFNGTAEQSGKPQGGRTDKKAKLYPFKLITMITAVNPDTKEPVRGNPAVFGETGDFDLAVQAFAEASGRATPVRWARVESTSYKQLNHGIEEEGLSCNDCHSKDGIFDFKSLGYYPQEVTSLTKPFQER